MILKNRLFIFSNFELLVFFCKFLPLSHQYCKYCKMQINSLFAFLMNEWLVSSVNQFFAFCIWKNLREKSASNIATTMNYGDRICIYIYLFSSGNFELRTYMVRFAKLCWISLIYRSSKSADVSLENFLSTGWNPARSHCRRKILQKKKPTQILS